MRGTRTGLFAATAAVALGLLAGCGGSSSTDEAIADAQQAANQAVQVAEQATKEAASLAEQAIADARETSDQVAQQVQEATEEATKHAGDIQEQIEQATELPAAPPAMAPAEPPAAPPADPAEENVEIELPPGPYEPGGLKTIAAELVAKLGYEPKVLEVTIADSFVTFDVQDKNKPENVDRYTWRGGLLDDGAPVELIGDGDLDANVFPLADVRFDAVTKLVKAGNSLEIEGAKTNTMIIGRMLAVTDTVVWLVNVDGTRDSKQLRADLNGKILEIL